MSKDITHQLNNISLKLDEYFMPIYYQKSQATQPTQNNNSSKTVIHNNYYSSDPWFYPGWFYGGNRQTVINNYNYDSKKNCKKDDKDEDDDKNTKAAPITGMILIAAAAISGTYLLAKDEYTNYVNSEIEKDISNLKERAVRLNYADITEYILSVEDSFNVWKKKYLDRTCQIRNSKITGTMSGLSIGAGYFFGSGICLTGGTIGLIGSVCLFTWNYLTKKIKTEENAFDELFGAVRRAHVAIEQTYSYPDVSSYASQSPMNTNPQGQPLYASAPPYSYGY